MKIIGTDEDSTFDGYPYLMYVGLHEEMLIVHIESERDFSKVYRFFYEQYNLEELVVFGEENYPTLTLHIPFEVVVMRYGLLKISLLKSKEDSEFLEKWNSCFTNLYYYMNMDHIKPKILMHKTKLDLCEI